MVLQGLVYWGKLNMNVLWSRKANTLRGFRIKSIFCKDKYIFCSQYQDQYKLYCDFYTYSGRASLPSAALVYEAF